MLIVFLLLTQDYMKMLQPPEETPEDRQVLKILAAIDQAVAQKKTADAQALTQRLQSQPSAKKSLDVLTKSRDPMTRLLGAYGFRLLPIKNGFRERLQYLLMDPEAGVRQQVLLYVAQEPASADLQSVQMSLSDAAPLVRAAAVGAIVRTAKKPEQAAALLRQRLKQEQDQLVIRQIKIGFTAMGMPTPEVTR